MSEGYIQLSLANSPMTNGYIQIQQLEKTEAPIQASKTELGLLASGVESPGYSKVGPVSSSGYIQFPGNSVLISPGLLDQADLSRGLETARNTVV